MSFSSPLAALLHWEATTPNNVMFHQPLDSGMRTYTYAQATDEIRRMASALKSMDFPAGSKIALISKNCAHWMMADFAIMMAGYVSVPLYPTLTADSIEEILLHSESKAIFVGKMDDFSRQKAGIPPMPIISVEAYGIKEALTWEQLVANHSPLQQVATMQPDDLITLIYTSGTTGSPKGVMHTVKSFTKVPATSLDIIHLPENPRYFSYLPLSHVAERIAIEIAGVFRGASFTFPYSLDTFGADLAATQPHMFFAVPRILAKFQEKVLEKMPQSKLDTLLKIPILNGIIRKKIQKAIGLYAANREGYIAVGAAPIAVSLLEWFQSLGITVHQAYGMTEDCVLSHYNLVGANKKGSVGRPVKGVKTKISPEGELRIYSECLMKGYYKEPKITAEMFDEEGYLKTGDIGEYDHDGYFTITGRIKDQFKTDKGKYISPAPIELAMLQNTDIEQICIVGTGIPQPIALVVPSASGKAKLKGSLAESITQSIQSVNKELEAYEKISKAVIMNEDWTVDNGLMTPTLKVKRNQVEKIHSPYYSTWYDSTDKVIWE